MLTSLRMSKIFVAEDVESARLILVLGYRSGVKVHGKEEFYRERTSVQPYHHQGGGLRLTLVIAGWRSGTRS